MPNILVTGGSGQLAKAIAWASKGSKNCYTIANRTELDICNSDTVGEYLRQHDISVVVNSAAYTNVDAAEEDEQAAYAINSDAVERLATLCKELNIRLIHLSTDYVFGGDKSRTTPYTEGDQTAPMNVYGRSKAEGERSVTEHGGVVIRTSWLYAPWGKNFVRTIVRVAKEKHALSVVDDQRGRPTSALGLAEAIVAIIDNRAIERMSGIYHYADVGDCSWYDFAREIVDIAGIADCKVERCKTHERQMRAARPAYSVLDTQRIATIEGVRLESRTERLRRVIKLMEENYE